MSREFLAESFEGLDRMELCLTELESRPEDVGLVDEIFRVIHTLKGSTGFLGFQRLERLAHAGEHVMGALRAQRVKGTGEVISGLLAAVDRMRSMARLIERSGADGAESEADDAGLLARLECLSVPLAEAVSTPEVSEEQAGGMAGTWEPGSDRSLRVEVEVLNRMMNLVGELVLTRNQVLQSGFALAGFEELSRRLDDVTSALRTNVMQARMQPVSQLFAKFPRMVRDLSLSCGKEVRLVLEGQETGLDKSLLEVVRDPLTHALRNAIDHGIEAAEVREACGKERQGLVRVRAFQQNSWVVIEMEDDGAGVPKAQVLAKAVERKQVEASVARSMTEEEVLRLIFLPGLSTRAGVSVTSGRGVGMDVVKSNVERAGGSVEIESTEGQGTLLRIKVPLTLAIMPALVVVSGGQSFCVPEGALREVVHVPWNSEEPELQEIFELREWQLPMVCLDVLLGTEQNRRRRLEHGFYVAVLDFENSRFALGIESFLASEEIVVKPLTEGLREIEIFSGVAVLGTGELALILDVAAMWMRAGKQPSAAVTGYQDQTRASVFEPWSLGPHRAAVFAGQPGAMA